MIPCLSTNFNFPLSGNVNQKIEPDWFFGTIGNEVGDSEIEKEVFFKIASYGRQIGVLTDAITAIAGELQLDSSKISALSELKELQAKVEAVKTSKKGRVKENAKAIMEKLRRHDPEGFESLLKEYKKNG